MVIRRSGSVITSADLRLLEREDSSTIIKNSSLLPSLRWRSGSSPSGNQVPSPREATWPCSYCSRSRYYPQPPFLLGWQRHLQPLLSPQKLHPLAVEIPPLPFQPGVFLLELFEASGSLYVVHETMSQGRKGARVLVGSNPRATLEVFQGISQNLLDFPRFTLAFHGLVLFHYYRHRRPAPP